MQGLTAEVAGSAARVRSRRLLADSQFLRELYPKRCGEIAERGYPVQTKANFFLREIRSVVCGLIAHRFAYFRGGVYIKSLGDDHGIVGPSFHDDRSFLGQELASRNRAFG